MYIGIKSWRRNEWTSFILIFLVLTLQLLFVGYPSIFLDSRRYLNAAVFLKTNPYSPTLVCYLIKPLVALMGAWGFAVFQMAMLTYALVSALKFFNKNSTIGIISIIMSAAGFMATAVMMDIYTAVGLLALFLILNGSRDILLHIILSLCYVAHYGNVFLFPICAVLYWLIFNRKNFATLALPIILFIIPLIMAFLVNYGLEKDFRFLSKAKYSFLAARIMIDSPEITRAYMKKYPQSQLTKHRQEYEHTISHKRRVESLLWSRGKRIFNKFGGSVKFNKEAKQFIVYALKNYPGILLQNVIYNTYKFLKWPNYKRALVPKKASLKSHIDYMRKIKPHQKMNQARKSLQYRDNLSTINIKSFYEACYYTSLLVISAFLILSICFPELRKAKYFSFVIFAIIVLLFNALVMQNSKVAGRYQVRVLLLPCLAMCLIISDLHLWRKDVKLTEKSF